jgi:hypothetical protein
MSVLTNLDYSAENKVTKVIGFKKFNGEVRFGIYPPLKPLCAKKSVSTNLDYSAKNKVTKVIGVENVMAMSVFKFRPPLTPL